MKLSEEGVRKLKDGSIIYYHEYDPGQEKVTFEDVLLVVGKTDYSGPLFRVLFSKINKPSEQTTASIYEISNGRAYAFDDKDAIVKHIFVQGS